MSTVATTEQPLAKNDIRSLLQSEKVRDQIELALPRHMTPERMMRVALTAVNKNPKLLDCTPESVLLSLMTCSQYGVEPDGRNAHLVPYNNKKGEQWVMECQFQWDYKGLVAQIRKAPEVADVYADYICEKDVYKISRGLHRDLIHEVDIVKPRGPIVAAYSVCLFRDGTTSFELMTIEEIEAIRMRSKSTDKKTGKSIGPWLNDYTEMCKKTVVKRHSKMLPLPTEIALAVNADSEFDELPKAQAHEIKKASIPERAEPKAETEPKALAENTQTETRPLQKQQEKVAVAKEVPAEKPKAARLEKKSPPSPPAESNTETAEEGGEQLSPIAAKAKKMLEDAGYTVPELLRAARAEDWLKEDVDFDAASISILGDQSLSDFIDESKDEGQLSNWEMVLDVLASRRK